MLPGSTELLIIFCVALLIFGPSKLPKLGGAIGESIRNFRKGVRSQDSEEELPKNKQTSIEKSSSTDTNS